MSMPSLPWQVVCEGDGDRGFIERLAEAYDMPKFEVTLSSERKGGLEGAIAAFETFADRDIVKRILIVADNDDSPHDRFQEIQKMVRRVASFPVPKEPVHIRPSQNVRVAVIMLPATGENGNLETLFLKEVQKTTPALLECVNAFVTCQRNGTNDDWNPGDRHKMVLRSALAATLRKNPNCSLNYVWSEDGCPMNIQSDTFKWIADFMREFFQ